MPRRRRQRFFVSRSMTSRHGVGSFMPPFRRASFASSTWSSVVLIVKTFVPGWTRAAVPVGEPNAARIPSEIRSAPAPVAILFSRSTLCGYTRSLRWYAFPAFFAMYRFAEIRAASRAMCRIWHCSSATRWIVTGNFVRRSPISNWLIRICGTPPMYSFRVYAWPRISRYMLAGLRVMAGGARRRGLYIILRDLPRARPPPGKGLSAGRSVAGPVHDPREAGRERPHGQGAPPRGPEGRDRPAREGARRGPGVPLRRPRRRVLRPHPRPPPSPRGRVPRQGPARRGRAGPAGCEGPRRPRRRRPPEGWPGPPVPPAA